MAEPISITNILAVPNMESPGTSYTTNTVPTIYTITEAHYMAGLIVGGPIPDGWTGAHLYVWNNEPTLATFTGARDHFLATRPGQIMILNPKRNGPLLRDVVFPTADTHGCMLNAANSLYRVQNGSVLLFGDSNGNMRLSVYFFHDLKARDVVIEVLNDSRRYMSKLWTKKGLPERVALLQSPACPPTGAPRTDQHDPTVIDVITVIRRDVAASGGRLSTKMATVISGLQQHLQEVKRVEEKRKYDFMAKQKAENEAVALAKRKAGEAEASKKVAEQAAVVAQRTFEEAIRQTESSAKKSKTDEERPASVKRE